MATIDRRAFLRASSTLAGSAALLGCTAAIPSPAPTPASSLPTPTTPAVSGRYEQTSVRLAQGIQRLDGAWRLLPDPQNLGRDKRWFAAVQPAAKAAPVPGSIQEVFPGYFGVAWYWREFTATCLPDSLHNVWLHFEGHVDYVGEIWLNGQPLGSYEGGEGPFDLDATAALQVNGVNLLAVRILDPTDTPIDGYVLKEVPHRNKTMSPDAGSSSNYGGILEPVELRALPVVSIAAVFVRPERVTGRVPISVTLANTTGLTVAGRLVATIGPAAAEEAAIEAATAVDVDVAPGAQVAEIALQVNAPRVWDVQDPYLYRVKLRLTATVAGQALASAYTVRTGFRDFRVEGGYFRLNGRRLYIRSAHTGNRYPFTQRFPGNPDTVRQDLINARAAGFNMIRFIWGAASRQQLDFCDEMGLLVYEETYASWPLAPSAKLSERFERSVGAIVVRDRNHPCVVIHGLLNETNYGPAFQEAVAYLPRLRELDPTRLVLLNSGRFDSLLTVGSVSNPGSATWEYEWGAEGPAAEYHLPSGVSPPLAYYAGAGDVHFYPKVPQTPETDRLLRGLGQDTKPVFLSEYGIGSLLNAEREARRYEEIGADPGSFRTTADRLAKDWLAWGFDGVYPFLEDLLLESQRLHNRQRLVGFNLIRANPRICGYSLTSLVDGLTGEGLWTYTGEWKRGIMDTLADGWAPLRWCLFVQPTHVYTGQPFHVEAVLANDGVLAARSYPATFRIWNSQGVAWEQKAQVEVPAPSGGTDPALALPVFLDEVRVSGPAGPHQFAVSMDHAAPAGARLTFHVSSPPGSPGEKMAVLGWGLDSQVNDWLGQHGVAVRPLAGSADDARETILVGTPAEGERDLTHWTDLMSRVARGSAAVFMDTAALQRGYQQLGWLPLAGRKGFVTDFFDWLYHKECVAKVHPIFAGLQAGGIMDWDYYGPVISNHFFTGQRVADQVVAAAFATGYPAPNGYVSGIMLGIYNFGAGHFIVNTFRVLENVAQQPAADRLLLNLVQYGHTLAAGPSAPIPADWAQTLAAIDYVPQ